MRAKRRAATLIAAAALCLGGSVIAAAPAMAATETISGAVTCFYGNDQNVGDWVSTSNGTSGFASHGPNGNDQEWYSYSGVNVGGSYSLHVGCGNTPQSWGITFYTPTVTGTYYNWICSASTQCYAS